LLNPTLASGVITALTPPTSAARHVPSQMFWQAMAVATAADEHAVSMDTLGPVKSNRYEMRLAAMLSVEPLLVYASTSSRFGSCTPP
jgi:hypothetical protein